MARGSLAGADLKPPGEKEPEVDVDGRVSLEPGTQSHFWKIVAGAGATGLSASLANSEDRAAGSPRKGCLGVPSPERWDSGSRVVIEEFLTGPEVSVLSFTDGKTVVPMISSMDHKRALDGDQVGVLKTVS